MNIKMNIKDCKYIKNEMKTEVVQIKATINDEVWFVPFDPDNTWYAEIMKQVDAGELTIESADEE